MCERRVREKDKGYNNEESDDFAHRYSIYGIIAIPGRMGDEDEIFIFLLQTFPLDKSNSVAYTNATSSHF